MYLYMIYIFEILTLSYLFYRIVFAIDLNIQDIDINQCPDSPTAAFANTAYCISDISSVSLDSSMPLCCLCVCIALCVYTVCVCMYSSMCLYCLCVYV